MQKVLWLGIVGLSWGIVALAPPRTLLSHLIELQNARNKAEFVARLRQTEASVASLASIRSAGDAQRAYKIVKLIDEREATEVPVRVAWRVVMSLYATVWREETDGEEYTIGDRGRGAEPAFSADFQRAMLDRCEEALLRLFSAMSIADRTEALFQLGIGKPVRLFFPDNFNGFLIRQLGVSLFDHLVAVWDEAESAAVEHVDSHLESVDYDGVSRTWLIENQRGYFLREYLMAWASPLKDLPLEKRSVLTDEQTKTYLDLLEDMRQKRPHAWDADFAWLAVALKTKAKLGWWELCWNALLRK